MLELRASRQSAYVLIAHEIYLAAAIADRVLVMRAGRIIEAGLPCDVLKHPREHYTRKLLAAAPSLDEALELRAVRRRVPVD